MYDIRKERMDLNVIEQRLCDQARMMRLNAHLIAHKMDVVKKDNNENAENNGQNFDRDHDDQSEATENDCEDLVNVLQNNIALSYNNVEGMGVEKKAMTENIIEFTVHNVDIEVLK